MCEPGKDAQRGAMLWLLIQLMLSIAGSCFTMAGASIYTWPAAVDHFENAVLLWCGLFFQFILLETSTSSASLSAGLAGSLIICIGATVACLYSKELHAINHALVTGTDRNPTARIAWSIWLTEWRARVAVLLLIMSIHGLIGVMVMVDGDNDALSANPFAGASIAGLFVSYLLFHLLLLVPILVWSIRRNIGRIAAWEHSILVVFYLTLVGAAVGVSATSEGRGYLSLGNWGTYNALASFFFFALPLPMWLALAATKFPSTTPRPKQQGDRFVLSAADEEDEEIEIPGSTLLARAVARAPRTPPPPLGEMVAVPSLSVYPLVQKITAASFRDAALNDKRLIAMIQKLVDDQTSFHASTTFGDEEEDLGRVAPIKKQFSGHELYDAVQILCSNRLLALNIDQYVFLLVAATKYASGTTKTVGPTVAMAKASLNTWSIPKGLYRRVVNMTDDHPSITSQHTVNELLHYLRVLLYTICEDASKSS